VSKSFRLRGRLTTVDLLIREPCFAKKETMFSLSKAADLTLCMEAYYTEPFPSVRVPRVII
jgi:hypothetical protein